MIIGQVFDAINIGLIILDLDLKVERWNRWMEINSGISVEDVHGQSIKDIFPELKGNRHFARICKSVVKFGTCCMYSQKLHHFLFPVKSSEYFSTFFEHMQQSCTVGPLRNEKGEITHLFIYVQDITESAVYEKKLHEANMKDGLTGVFNRRFMEEKLADELNRKIRYGGEFSLIMMDIDFFKKVNDQHGHQCGDFILQSVAGRLASLIRNVDCIARYGGEEFCSILPETGMDGACQVAERFRASIEGMDNVFNGLNVKVTISLGVASLRTGLNTPDAIISKADDALYRAKMNGRNRFEVMQYDDEDSASCDQDAIVAARPD